MFSGSCQFKSGGVEKNVLVERLNHFHSLTAQLLDQVENIYFSLLVDTLLHDVYSDKCTRPTYARAKIEQTLLTVIEPHNNFMPTCNVQ